MTAIELQTFTSKNVSNPELALVDLSRHLEAKRTEGATVQAIQNPENVDKKKKAKLHSTNKTAPTLPKAGKDNNQFQALVKMMEAILAMQDVLSKNMGKRQTYQADIGKSMAAHAVEEQKYVAAQLKKIAKERAEAHHRSWWQKAFGWALAAIAVALAVLTAGLGAALVVAAMTVLTMTGTMKKGFLGKINSSIYGKIGLTVVMCLLSGGLAGGINEMAEGTALDFTEGAAEEGFNSAAAVGGGAMTATSNNLVGTVIYDTYKLCGGRASKKAKEICDAIGMVLTILAALAAAKASAPEAASLPSSAKLAALRKSLNALAVITAAGTSTFEILASETQLKLAGAMKEYGKDLAQFNLLKDLTDLNTQSIKESQEDIRHQTSTFEQENQTFSVMTMPYRTIAQVLA